MNTDNLYVIDFICHPVNSPKAYEAYVRDIERQYGKKAKSVWFKNKEKSWNTFSTRIDFEDSDEYYIKDRYTDDFYKGFLKHHLFSRSSCSDCAFKGIDRVSDITLADAWGVNIAKSTDHGVSTLIIHTEKGAALFDGIKSNIYYEEKSIEQIKKGNANLSSSVVKGKHSDYFYKQLADNVPFSTIIAEIEEGKADAQPKPTAQATAKSPVFSVPKDVVVNGAVIRAHATARIIVKEGATLTLNNDKFPGSNAECLVDLRICYRETRWCCLSAHFISGLIPNTSRHAQFLARQAEIKAIIFSFPP